MWTLASYADKDKENVYETPGFNKTKNPNFGCFFFFSYTILIVFSWFDKRLRVARTEHFTTWITLQPLTPPHTKEQNNMG